MSHCLIMHLQTFHTPRFKRLLLDRYDWSNADLDNEWEAAKTNPSAIWAKDDYGEPVCSLLKVTSASNARELSHRKGIHVAEQALTDDMDGAFTSVLAWLV